MYFSKIGTIKYAPNEIISKDVTNILVSIQAKYRLVQDVTQYYFYTIKEGETPEWIAFEKYGDAELHWLIFVMNNIIDPYFDWPMTQRKFEDFIASTYGLRANDIHHMINLNTGKRLDPVDQEAVIRYRASHGEYPLFINPITNRDHEFALNEERRQIKILMKPYVNDMIDQFETLMSTSTLISGINT